VGENWVEFLIFSLRELMQSLNRSFLGKPSVREAVRDFVGRQDQPGSFAASHTVRFASLPQLDFNQPDETIHWVEFFEKCAPETLILSLDFSSRARQD
jgi:hypothetical protein